MIRDTGLASYSFDIFDYQGNLVQSGFLQGELPRDKMLYPLTLKINANTTEEHFFLELKVVYTEDNSLLDNIGNLISKLNDDLLKKLDELKAKLDGILSTLAQIDDYLSNPAYLEAGLNDMSNAVHNATKNPLADASSTVTTLSGLTGTGSSSAPGDFEIPLTIGGVKFNAFDISALSTQLELIRALMKAIIWIEFAMFCIRILVPKFKV